MRTSVIIPAKNEAAAIGSVVKKVRMTMPDAEILVVDDGSTDATVILAEAQGARVIRHRYSMGNGAAVKSGARAAAGEILVFMDGDGQHSAEDIPRLLARLEEGYDMVVGARGLASQAGVHRAMANRLYNRLASWMVGRTIPDLTSGFRVARAKYFRQFISLLPNGFSYPTTITMSFFRAGYGVAYEPILAPNRVGKSHIRLVHDGLRFLLIIFKVGTLFSPLRLFFPISVLFFLTALGYYGYTFFNYGRFTNMSALLFVTSILVFLIGLVSEQITALMYKDTQDSK